MWSVHEVEPTSLRVHTTVRVRQKVFDVVLLVEEKWIVEFESPSQVGSHDQGTESIVAALESVLASGPPEHGAVRVSGEPPVVAKEEPPVPPGLPYRAGAALAGESGYVDGLTFLPLGPYKATLLCANLLLRSREVEVPLPQPSRVPRNPRKLSQLLDGGSKAVVVHEVLGIVTHHQSLPAEEAEGEVLVQVEGVGLDEVSGQDKLERSGLHRERREETLGAAIKVWSFHFVEVYYFGSSIHFLWD